MVEIATWAARTYQHPGRKTQASRAHAGRLNISFFSRSCDYGEYHNDLPVSYIALKHQLFPTFHHNIAERKFLCS